MSADDATHSNSGWTNNANLLGADGGSSSGNGRLNDVLLDHDMTAPSRKECSLQNYWPIPVAGLAWLAHLRYRRHFPRRIPHFTPLKPLELYTFAGLAGSVLAEQLRFFENLKQDSDLLVLTSFAVSLRELWMVRQAEFEGIKHLHTNMWRAGFYPSAGGLLERAMWMHNHWWASAVEWNIAMCSLQPFSTAVSPHDMDICITHIANTFELGTGVLSIDRALPFALVFLGLTPFGMWVRLLARPSLRLTLPIHGLQRILFYLSAYVSMGRQYQYLRYPATLHDKHGVASMLLDVLTRSPSEPPQVEELRPRLRLGEGGSETL